jgi:FkbM family methyltransferase
MSSYWDERFLRHLQGIDLKYIFEVGARYGDESIMLSKVFNTSHIYSFECNPNTLMTCVSKLKDYENITLFCHGLGEKEEVLPFYSYTRDNDGASSLYKRIDFEDTQELTGHVLIRTLQSVVLEHTIPHIDLLCMDIQGNELSVLKGSAEYLKHIKYIIMEEPKPVINTQFLPEGIHSKYLDTPTSSEIKEFMLKNNFVEIERIDENMIEDNVMYKRITNK